MHSIENRKKWGLKGAQIRWNKEPKPEERFWRNVTIGTKDQCWEWKKSIGYKTGYGKWKIKGKSISSHRAAYEFVNGPIPSGFCICHHCDNRSCCNPSHLFIGTHRDNMQDAKRKGRLHQLRGKQSPNYGKPGPNRGEKCPFAKLKNADVYMIRSLTMSGDLTQKQIADMFHIGQDSISRIKNRKRWRHLP